MTTRIRVTDMTYRTHEEVVQTAIEMAANVERVEFADDSNEVTAVGEVDPDEVLEKIRMAGYDAEIIT
ncbi:hypothetical protein [Haloarchaeobius sp. TZWWS8]|uniref:hypothetical protein n=1 Tax=Haloarchaeobius sp. TZWWS8 TaxID=3446121 RepID=UPI003EBEC5DC